jgi:deazaflavin-dependent oxidoreductase (nitroreductase family)
MKAPHWFWRLIHFGPRIAYWLGLGWLVGRSILLLTTLGRKSGKARVTPLAYEARGDTILVASARGSAADWLQNILANPQVSVRVGRRQLEAIAEVTTDAELIADYLERQFKRKPALFGAILRSEGLPAKPSREDLVRFAPKRPMVTIRPIKQINV